MSKKPAAVLSAGLVAVKGTAAPAPDMHGRAAPPSTVVEGPVAVPPPSTPEQEEQRGLSPLNFRVPANFRREFKTYAARHDLKLNELLRRSFAAYRRVQGD